MSNHSLYQSLFQVKVVFGKTATTKKMSSTACNSNGHTGAFPQDIRHLISEVFCV